MMVILLFIGLEMKVGQCMMYYYKVNVWILKNVVFVNEVCFVKFLLVMQQIVFKFVKDYEMWGWDVSCQIYECDEVEFVKIGVCVFNFDVILQGDMCCLGECLMCEWLYIVGMEEVDILLNFENKCSKVN